MNPEETLDVNGRIKLGDDLTVPTPTNPGVIRWNETTQDFEGYTGTRWVSLTKSSTTGGWGSQSVNENNIIGQNSGSPILGFGYSVAISGNYAIIGIHNGGSPGKVYAYSNTGGIWSLDDILEPDFVDDVNGNFFGSSVAISGDYAIVGASKIDDNGIDSGAAYVFVRSGNFWFLQEKLLPMDGEANDRFGVSVAIDGDYAVVGAHKDNDNGTDAGAAYIFNRSGNIWAQQDKLTPSDGAAGFQFGDSVAISGDYTIIGAPFDDENGTNAGAAYIFNRSGNTWSQQNKLNQITGALFGFSVAIDDDYGIIGGVDFAYVINRSGNTWTLGDKLNPLDNVTGAFFGISVAISGDFAIVGATLDSIGGMATGSAYIFSRSGSTWSQQAKLTASDGAQDDRFGTSVAISSDAALVGAPENDENGPDLGAVYFFNN